MSPPSGSKRNCKIVQAIGAVISKTSEENGPRPVRFKVFPAQLKIANYVSYTQPKLTMKWILLSPTANKTGHIPFFCIPKLRYEPARSLVCICGGQNITHTQKWIKIS